MQMSTLHLLLYICLSINHYTENVMQKTSCECNIVQNSETTYWGHTIGGINKKIIPFQSKIVGCVKYNVGEPADDALIEVYTHPEIMNNLTIRIDNITQKRIAACKTNKDGSFCIKNIPNGKYELRCSRDGYEVTSYIIRFNNHTIKKRKNRNLDITLIIST